MPSPNGVTTHEEEPSDFAKVYGDFLGVPPPTLDEPAAAEPEAIEPPPKAKTVAEEAEEALRVNEEVKKEAEAAREAVRRGAPPKKPKKDTKDGSAEVAPSAPAPPKSVRAYSQAQLDMAVARAVAMTKEQIAEQVAHAAAADQGEAHEALSAAREELEMLRAHVAHLEAQPLPDDARLRTELGQALAERDAAVAERDALRRAPAPAAPAAAPKGHTVRIKGFFMAKEGDEKPTEMEFATCSPKFAPTLTIGVFRQLAAMKWPWLTTLVAARDKEALVSLQFDPKTASTEPALKFHAATR